ncbi:MAG: GNAT family N-acetyltransferase [Sphingomonadaceae bacterium]
MRDRNMFDFQPRLEGALIAMRPMVEADFEPLYAVAADPLIWAIHPVPERAERAVFRSYVDDAFSDRGGLVAIERSSGKIAGFSRYSQRYVGEEEIEIGWTFLARALWGGDHNRDMKRIMLTHALAHFPRVIFRIAESNLRSRRAMEKIGGEAIPWDETVTAFGRAVPYVAYAITRERFATSF